jgi:hypothetical protein
MKPILDPRAGDIEDDASSTTQRTLLALAGSLLAEISLPKLVVTWLLLIGLPGLLLGAAPLMASIWIASVKTQAVSIHLEIWPALALVPLFAIGWWGGRRLLRLAESSFWSLNALAVQPVYIVFREGLRHLAEGLVSRLLNEQRRAVLRSATAAASGIVVCALALALIAAAWPATRWTGSVADLATPAVLLPHVLANSLVLLSAYLAAGALAWGVADAAMAQPRGMTEFAQVPQTGRAWRVAHLSDLHTVGEAYGFRIESGRAGPRGNERLRRTLALLDDIHRDRPIDAVLITGDLTDAGRSAEWAEFLAALSAFPALAPLVVALPGNHDVNVVDRASPARLELPTSPMKRLRKMRMLSMLGGLQGDRMHVVDPSTGRPGVTLAEALLSRAATIEAFADTGSMRHSRALSGLWEAAFPLVVPPASEDGLGVVVLNSNAETHFSFTNALGLVSAEQVRALVAVTRHYPGAVWLVGLHHHVVEYPHRTKALSERIGTALINGSWFVRQLRHLAGRVVVMHGHRHVDWIGTCGGMTIVSAPSPVMDADDGDETAFYVHTLARAADGALVLLEPQRISVPGAPAP